MKTSLRQTLNDAIRAKGYLSLAEVHEIARESGAKESNAERRLRPSESPAIEAVRSPRGFILGYRWIGETVLDRAISIHEKIKKRPIEIGKDVASNLPFRMNFPPDPELIKRYPDLFLEKVEDRQQVLL